MSQKPKCLQPLIGMVTPSLMRWLCFVGILTAGSTSATSNSVAVLTHHNDGARTGANLGETLLNTHNVNSNQFGLVGVRNVDDEIYAQPLIMTNVVIAGKGARNLVLVATVNDSVYAFDADDLDQTEPYWHTNFLGKDVVPPRNTDMTGACDGHYTDFSGNIGIVGTPVIDAASQTLYVVARTKEQGSNYVQKLHALNLQDGSERPNSPVLIEASCQGTADDSTNNVVSFDPLHENQRPALALAGWTVYIAWASHCDWGPYHGWLLGYDTRTLARTVVYNTTPDGEEGGIWMSGEAPTIDSDGALYVAVGNGTVGSVTDPRAAVNRGESLLKLGRNGQGLKVLSWFTPCNWKALNEGDLDFGSSGVLLVPGARLAVSGSKEGKLYVLNQDQLGGMCDGKTDTNIVQTIQVTPLKPPNNIHSSPVFWQGANGSYVYVWGESDYLRQYELAETKSRFKERDKAHSPTRAPIGMPGGFLSISADGNKAGTGIVWGSHPLSGDANHDVCPGILHAYDAEDVSHELWNSEQVAKRDRVGNFAKFCPPTVANGKVYLATFSKRLCIYGLPK